MYGVLTGWVIVSVVFVVGVTLVARVVGGGCTLKLHYFPHCITSEPLGFIVLGILLVTLKIELPLWASVL